MNNRFWKILVATGAFLAMPSMVMAAGAPHYTLTPSSGGPYTVGSNFSVILGIETGTREMVLGDIEGRFDSAKIELVSIEKVAVSEKAFPYDEGVTLKPDNTKGEFGITLADPDNPSLLQGKVANGKLFKLNFKAKAVGTATVTFFCQSPSTVDSNILIGKEGADEISCSENSSGSYVIGASSSTSTSTTTTTTTKTLPRTASTAQTAGMIILGGISVIGAFLLKFL